MRNCEICGKEFTEKDWPGHWTGDFTDICSEECFTIKHWRQNLEEDKANPNTWIVEGKNHYRMSHSVSSKDGFVGFGGRKFYIHFKDGRKIVCNNVWHQGEIPDFLLEDFPTNVSHFSTVPEEGIEYTKY